MANLEDIGRLLEAATIAGPADEEMIHLAEAKLGVEFPRSYREFLSQYGAALCPGFSIAGLFQSHNDVEPPLWPDIVTSTLQMRRASHGMLPQGYIPISDDGGDYTFYLNTAQLGPENECPVVVLGPGADAVIVAEDFFAFVDRAFTGRLSF